MIKLSEHICGIDPKCPGDGRGLDALRPLLGLKADLVDVIDARGKADRFPLGPSLWLAALNQWYTMPKALAKIR
jgi:hypothetical protein